MLNKKIVFGILAFVFVALITYSFAQMNNNNESLTPNDIPSIQEEEDINNGEVATQTFTVTFNSEGGSAVAAQEVVEGNEVIMPEMPTRRNHTFIGWFLGEALYDFSNPVTNNITLIARWIVGAGTPTVNPNQPNTPGGATAGGGGASGGTTPGGGTSPGGGGTGGGTPTPPPTIFTVAFNLNGGTPVAATPANRTCQPGTGPSCSIGALPGIGSVIRNGFAFTGWGVNNNCTNAIESLRVGVTYITDRTSRTLHACWNPVFAQITIAGSMAAPVPNITEGGNGTQNVTISNVQGATPTTPRMVRLWLFHPNNNFGARDDATVNGVIHEVFATGGRTRMTVELPYDCRSGNNLVPIAVDWKDGAGPRTYNITMRGNSC